MSSLSSIVLGLILLVAFSFALIDADEIVQGVSVNYQGLLVSIIAFMAAQSFGDYLALAQTRLFLNIMARHQKFKLVLILLDFVLNIAIYLLMVGAVVFVGNEGDLGAAFNVVSEMIRLSGNLVSGLARGDAYAIFGSPASGVIVASTLATTFITSVWLWIALLTGPVLKALAFLRGGVSVLGRVFDAEAQPFAALGYVFAALILVIGAAVQIVLLAV